MTKNNADSKKTSKTNAQRSPELPPELWADIASKLKKSELRNLRVVNKELEAIVDGVEPRFRYTPEDATYKKQADNEAKLGLTPEDITYKEHLTKDELMKIQQLTLPTLQAVVDYLRKDPHFKEKLNNLLIENCYKGNLIAIQYLLTQGADPTAPYFMPDPKTDPNGGITWFKNKKITALHAAVLNGHWQSLNILWQACKAPDINTILDANGQTLLHYGANQAVNLKAKGMYSRENFMRFMLENKANLEQPDKSGQTPSTMLKEGGVSKKEIKTLIQYREKQNDPAENKEKGKLAKGKGVLDQARKLLSKPKKK